MGGTQERRVYHESKGGYILSNRGKPVLSREQDPRRRTRAPRRSLLRSPHRQHPRSNFQRHSGRRRSQRASVEVRTRLPSGGSGMNIAIVSNLNSGIGLQREYELLREFLMAEGHAVMGVQYDEEPYSGGGPCDLTIFLEVIPRNMLGLSEIG